MGLSDLYVSWYFDNVIWNKNPYVYRYDGRSCSRCRGTKLKMESRCDVACIHANTAFRIFRTFGKLVPRLSLNFYSLRGTDDKKIAQTENPYSFLSQYTCSYPSSLFSLPSLSSSSLRLFFLFGLFLMIFLSRSRHYSIFLFISIRTMLTSPSLLPSHRRFSRKSSRVGLGLLARTAWKDSPDPIAVSVPHLLLPLPVTFSPVSSF